MTQQEIIPSQVTQKPTAAPSSGRGSGHLQPLLLITPSPPLGEVPEWV